MFRFLLFKRTRIFSILGSLSYPKSSEDELRVIVGQLDRLVASLRQYVIEGNVPEYSVDSAEPLSEFTSEFPIHDIRPPSSPGGLDDDKHYPSSLTSKWFYERFGKLLKQYFGGFPNGPYTCKSIKSLKYIK